ncbi:hypothetical protein [Cupriavidus nantongensis]|uniref:hypothetical protein n=1 Tax=Cupriavidus nantongensis TaxID=1796606 RepID=UPI00123729E2|nr:hypothetical protein [Cupriavidus nantongensis]
MTVSIVRPIAVLSINYPEGPIADAIEAEVQQFLPPVSGLDGALTESERLEAYARAIHEERSEFIAMYGDAFGWEKRSVPREPARQSVDRFIGAVVSAE